MSLQTTTHSGNVPEMSEFILRGLPDFKCLSPALLKVSGQSECLSLSQMVINTVQHMLSFCLVPSVEDFPKGASLTGGSLCGAMCPTPKRVSVVCVCVVMCVCVAAQAHACLCPRVNVTAELHRKSERVEGRDFPSCWPYLLGVIQNTVRLVCHRKHTFII